MILAFDPRKGLIVVPVLIWGPVSKGFVRLALDTGATMSVVSWDAMLTLGYDPAVVKDRVQMTTGSGVEFAPRINIEKIQALEQERKNFPILCHSLPPTTTVDGVLGLDFFRGCLLTLDFKLGQVALE